MEKKAINLQLPMHVYEALVMSKGGEKVTEFITNAVIERCELLTHKQEGGEVVYITNPQFVFKPSEESEAAAVAIREMFHKTGELGEVAGLEQITRYLVARLVSDGKQEREEYRRAHDMRKEVISCINEYYKEK